MQVGELTTHALTESLLSTSGKTPTSTMRARLSDDLRELGFQSTFQRVGPNRFALRKWGLQEYIAPRFKKRTPNEVLACIPASAGIYPVTDFGYLPDFGLLATYISNPRNIIYIDRPEAESRTDIRQLVAYVMLKNEIGDILTYRRGTYSAAHPMLRGARCLGFGGHIQIDDAHSLFGLVDGGVYMASTREVAEELGGIAPFELRVCGAINDYSSPEGTRHVALVLEGILPNRYAETASSRERAVNDLRLMKPQQLWSSFHEFEFWSQLLIKESWPQLKPKNRATIRPRRKTFEPDALVVIGEIASGKITLANALRDQLGFSTISTRRTVSQLTGVPDFGTGSREQFQQRASEFISTPRGPRRLAEKIGLEAGCLDTPIVIDGVRHSETLRHLRNYFSSMLVFFVDSPRDKAFENYRSRHERDVSLHEFREVRHHPVEEQVSNLKQDADAYLFNGGSIEEMMDTFVKWWG